MQHVFVSYKHNDLDFAENVISRLEKGGYATWTDLKIGAGEEWRNAIDLAIKNAFALVVIMTPEAKESEYVTYEWAFACGVGIRVIPLMLKTTQLHPRLEALQHLDFTNPRNRPWDKLRQEVNAASRVPLSHSISIPLNSPPFIRQAVASLDSAVKSDRLGAIDTLVTSRTLEARAVLTEALIHPLPDVRGGAAEALGRIEDPAALPALTEALKDNHAGVRCMAAFALGRIGDPAALPTLTDALEDNESIVGQAAARALGRIGDAAALPALTEALKHSLPDVRISVKDAIDRLQKSTAVPGQ